MASQAITGVRFDVGRILQRGFSTLRRHGLIFLGLALLLAGVPAFFLQSWILTNMPVAATNPAALLSPSLGLWGFVSFLGGYLLQVTIVKGTINDIRGMPVELGDLLVTALKLILPMLGLTISIGFIALIGFILLIVPGIIAMLMFIVAVPVLVEEGRGVFGSMGRSRELTKGYRWWILLLIFLFAVVSGILGPLIVFLVSLFSGALPMAAAIGQALGSTVNSLLGTVMLVSLYVELRMVKDGADESALAAIFS